MKYTLKAIRVNAGETQKESAEAVGVSIETWANYEKGVTFPDVPVINKITQHFGVSYDNINFFCNDITV